MKATTKKKVKNVTHTSARLVTKMGVMRKDKSRFQENKIHFLETMRKTI